MNISGVSVYQFKFCFTAVGVLDVDQHVIVLKNTFDLHNFYIV